jgi:hypothetical protein
VPVEQARGRDEADGVRGLIGLGIHGKEVGRLIGLGQRRFQSEYTLSKAWSEDRRTCYASPSSLFIGFSQTPGPKRNSRSSICTLPNQSIFIHLAVTSVMHTQLFSKG